MEVPKFKLEVELSPAEIFMLGAAVAMLVTDLRREGDPNLPYARSLSEKLDLAMRPKGA